MIYKGCGTAYKCLTCGELFGDYDAHKERYPGGEVESFCPFCGSDDYEEVPEDEAERAAD